MFGHFGDRIGRKSMLVLSLLIMGLATFLVGCLPTYASIGVLAPVLLVVLRFAQGIGVGGEWGGAVLMSVEYAPKGKRGLFGSFPQIGVPHLDRPRGRRALYPPEDHGVACVP